MNTEVKEYILEGFDENGKPYEEISTDVRSLQELQTDVLRDGGSGYIRRL